MRKVVVILLCWLALSASLARAGTFPLKDGNKITGRPDSVAERGVIFQLEGGDFSPLITWDRLSDDAVRELLAEATTPKEKELLQPMVDSLAPEVAKRKEIVIKPVESPPRPARGVGIVGLFASPVGWFILLVLYGGNLFAAYEVHVYRRQPIALVCGLAAIPFLGVLSPIIFGCMPTQYPPVEPVVTPAMAEAAAAAATPEAMAAEAAAVEAAAEAAKQEAAAGPKLPEPIIFKKGDFTFNRRFIETKFAGFFRIAPSEEQKDLVLQVKCARGHFVGTRIARITPNEFYIQVFKNGASAEEMIPIVEVSEMQIRHKDLPES